MSVVMREGDKAPTLWDTGVDLTTANTVTLRCRRLGEDTVTSLTPTTKVDGSTTKSAVQHITDGVLTTGQYDTEVQAVFADGTDVTFGVGTLTILPDL